MPLPKIIQGGMGAGVSGWRLARAVSRSGQLGVVSGTALAVTFARQLQSGDPDRRLRFAMEHFPIAGVSSRLMDAYFIPNGKASGAPFKSPPMPTQNASAASLELTVAASFAEVFLAKQGHHGLVGFNLLEKIQLPNLASLFGAVLADVDYVLMGAGIPRAIPGILDCLAEGKRAELKIDVDGALPDEEFHTVFDPQIFCNGKVPQLKRPQFLGIVASATLAITLARKASGRVDGFVVEGPTAGGHNAPPRGALQLSVSGEPVYSPRDLPDLKKIQALGLPFWLAGSYARPEKLTEAIALGAAGIQVGTAFAFCEESGIRPDLKQQAIQLSQQGQARVFTDPFASPTGFPFKVLDLAGTLSDHELYRNRTRICDLGYLRQPYRKDDGTLGYRCPSEPVDGYLKKGGNLSETENRKCVCNGLMATIGLEQTRSDLDVELPLVTAGNDVADIARFLKSNRNSYTAADVIEYLIPNQS
jgi:NAD(P)H-dependent flavin oxidoreductase YrpB (nitropropane dioxygenase family)